ncbi:MAG: polynucleotide adenylyltransferase PcnB [Gammaproteobacteria bacterium]|nr:polynucleotide adenylyltransferase PcnB [Gammaproteobacteria bacterium]
MISNPLVIPRAEHTLSRAGINQNALKVLYRLREAGYAAYLVGGCVRDMLLGREPKDFDVSTDAHPEQVKELFRNCRLIGRRFHLAHVHFGREIIEVATFRALASEEDDGEDRLVENGRIIRDNVYGTIEEDAWRRDFTVNALYYNIDDFSVVDYVGGVEDLRAGVLRLIGDPETRYREDPVRMLRAVRFAVKLGFRLHPQTEAPLRTLAPLLSGISPARLYEEVLKLFLSGSAEQTVEMLRHYDLFQHLFPGAERSMSAAREGVAPAMIMRAAANTDARIAQDKPVTPAFLYAAFLWTPMRERVLELQQQGQPEMPALQQAAREVMQEQSQHAILPRRFSLPMREIWQMQPRLQRNAGKKALRLLEHPRFRAAYDFLLLRCEAGEDLGELCEWWTRMQETDEDGRQALCEQPAKRAGGDGRRKRRRRGRRRSGAEAVGQSGDQP